MNNIVWVIDDSLTVRKIIEVTLKREGYIVISFCDGVDALNFRGYAPAIILVDISLPKMDGYEVIKYFRCRTEYQPIYIMLSGRSSILDKLKARLAGATNFVVKPFTTSLMVSMVSNYIQQETPR